MHKPHGFSHGLIVLIFLVLGALGVIGYLAITRIYGVEDAKVTPAATKKAQAAEATPPASDLKTYENKEYGFSFQYPAAWKFEAEFANIRNMGDEGSVTITSPSGAVITFKANFGGKGGGCQEDPSDTPHHTKNCSTEEILKITPLADKGPDGAAINMYQFKLTGSGPDAKSEYGIYIDSGKHAPTTTGPIITDIGGFGLMDNVYGSIESHISGGDRSTPDYFKSQQAKDTELVLKTFKLLDVKPSPAT